MSVRFAEQNRIANSDVATTPAGSLALGTSSAQLVPANTGRVGLYVANVGAGDAFLALGAAATPNAGIYLKAGGGSAYLNDFLGAIYAVGTATTTIAFSEV